jgi:hypothetical protein
MNDVFQILQVVRNDTGEDTMQSRSLPSPWHKLLVTVHVIATVSVLGADLVLLALGIAGMGSMEPRAIYPIAHLVAAWLVAPLAALALGTGLLLGVLTPWGVFRYWWVTIKLAITVLLTGAVLFVLVPGLGATADVVTGLAPRPLTNAERVPLLVAPAVASSLLMLSVTLAVFKPRWRLRAHTAGAASPLGTRQEEPM